MRSDSDSDDPDAPPCKKQRTVRCRAAHVQRSAPPLLRFRALFAPLAPPLLTPLLAPRAGAAAAALRPRCVLLQRAVRSAAPYRA
jgi:hypothetical protein